MTSNAQKFASLVVELRSLLQIYCEKVEDIGENPVTHFALLHTLISLQFLEAYSQNEPHAVALYQSLMEQHAKLMVQEKKH